MFRHSVRHVVKYGEYKDFVAALGALNEASASVGLPSYSGFQTLFGDINEVWTEAEYESLEAHVQALEQAGEDEAWMAAFRAMLSHLVPGSARDYPLKAIEL